MLAHGATAPSFDTHLSRRIRSERQGLTERWIESLRDDSRLDDDYVVPEHELLRRIPGILEQVASFVSDPDPIRLETLVVQDLSRLAELRRCQGRRLSGLLREYQVLSELVLDLAEDAAAAYPGPSSLEEVVRAVHRLSNGLNVISAVTVQSFETWGDRYDQERRELLVSHAEILHHELGSRLGAAETAIKFLESRMPEAPDRRLRLYSLILESIQAGLYTIEDVAALSQAFSMDSDAGISLWLVVKESVRLAGREAGRRGIDLSVSGEVPDAEVPGAAVRVALSNLLSNAVRYHREDGDDRWITLSARRADESEGWGRIEITVEDNGPGVPEQARDGLFDYSFRGEGRDKRSGKGLLISRELLERVGGTISLDDGARGARFNLTVPNCRERR